MKREAAIRQLKKIKECTIEAGIESAFFLGFGTCLGVVRENDLIGHDGDTDVCILSDKITKDQEDKFYEILVREKMFEYRKRRKLRHDTGRLLWVSMKMEHDGIKSCCWFWQSFGDFLWHSKGDRWVSKIGRRRNLPIDFEHTVAIMKGIPATYLAELKQVKIWDDVFRIPRMYGSVLEYWYGDFMTPRKGGSSTTEVLCIVGDWNDQKTWKIMKMDNY